MQDTAFLVCEKELNLDFQELAAFHKIFLKQWSANKYIEDNMHMPSIDPQTFVMEYQNGVDAYLQNQNLRLQRLLISKKYMPFILLNEEKFYELFSDKYENLFTNMDISLSKESQLIQAEIIRTMRELKDQEMH